MTTNKHERGRGVHGDGACARLPYPPGGPVIPAKAGTYWGRPSAQSGNLLERPVRAKLEPTPRPRRRTRDSRLRGNDGHGDRNGGHEDRNDGYAPLTRRR